MTNWAALDVAIGLALVYSVMSLVASTLNEVLASALGWRAKFLERWLTNVLADPAHVRTFFAHPLIQPLMKQPRWFSVSATGIRKPSYIPSTVFSAVLLNLDAAGSAKRSPAEIVAALPSPELRAIATTLLHGATDDLNALRERIEHWYDDSMVRVSGWYKRRVQLVLALIGLIAAIVLNADTFQIVSTMWSDKTVRAAVVAEADRVAQTGQANTDLKAVARQVQEIQSLKVPLGWKLKQGDPRDLPHGARLWAAKVIGILFTTVALMLGAPFWFDLLSKLVRLRGSGSPPQAATEGAGKTGAPKK